ncbi:hypothetical protein RD792_006648 [Penstemon davidsonii]|uniref:Pentatricopeptide repeat-containing protein n=1 Tax=Penstemon davidsonii TaxID=160366 RepID=A0ABR0DCW5_9LAMI|nr:hypothetical protein RD792_006648 [Penstemon davidsonii]
MLTFRCARQTRRAFLSPPSPPPLLLFSTAATTTNANPISSSTSSDMLQHDAVHYFREWFMTRKRPLFDHIFEILRTRDDFSLDSALSPFNLHLTETLVLDVLNYEKNDVLSCLKFFDWAGRQSGFHHTRATFNAIFRILSKAKLMPLMLDFLQNFRKQRYVHKVTYHGILVVGYAISGKCELALQVFGKMRFSGTDLDGFAYHVLLNSLVEQGYFDVVETFGKEIRIRGFMNDVTHSIMMKSFVKQNELEEGELYLRSLISGDNMAAQSSGPAVATFVAGLCKDNQFERAALLVEELRRTGVVPMEPAYAVWIRELVNAGKLDGALEFLKDKRAVEGYIPDVFRFNTLICRLLRENRFEEMFDLLVEMKEKEILPDDVTMNAILCLLCKVGRMDIAMELYDSRAEFGLSVNCMAYNYLINTLLGDVSVDEAYRVLRNSIEQGFFPGEKTFLIIADALCREGKNDKMKELVYFTLHRNIMPSNLTYDKLISVLCNASRVDEGYWVHNLLNRLNKASRKSTYMNLVSGFSKSSRAEISARLLIEMQEKGYTPSRKLVREVICCICKMDNPEKLFFRLLEMQLDIPRLSTYLIYNYFIDGAGHAMKPELARQVHEMMKRSGLQPNWNSDISLLQSYLKSGNIAHAIHLFHDISKRRRKRKLWHTMIVGLCKANKPKLAVQVLEVMKSNRLTPSIECYEELIKLHCDLRQYHIALDLVNDMTQIGRPVSSFIGNVFLLHALRGRQLYYAWDTYSNYAKNLTPSSWMLGHLIGVFSGCVEEDCDDEYVEKLIQQCFHIDVYTNNMLLRRSSMNGMDHACKYFDRLCAKGYEPNRWSYDIIVHGLAKDGRNAEAKAWMSDMLRKGFNLTEATHRIV